MFTVRLIVGLIGIAVANLIAYITNISVIEVCALLSFILVIDNLTVKWIAYLVIKASMNAMEKPPKDLK